MRKTLLAALSALLCLSLSAQDLLQYNYRKNGKTYTGTVRTAVTTGNPKDDVVWIKLARVVFPDGGIVWKLRAEFEEPSAWKMPKNAPFTLRTKGGKMVTLKNNADAPNLVAPDGLLSGGKRVWWNYGEYYFEEEDMDKLLAGITDIDVQKRWSSDGYIQIIYKNDELGAALRQARQAILAAPKPAFELGSYLKSLQDQRGSRLVETTVLQVTGSLSVSLVYLYYAASNSESYDLNLFLPGKTIPINAPVTIVTKAGETVALRQEKDLVAGRVICYPTVDQIKAMARGVSSVSVQTTDGPASFSFSDASFANALERLYQALQTVAIL